MPNDISQMMRSMTLGFDNFDYQILKITNQMFIDWDKKKPPRYGWHVSELTGPFKGKGQVCLRQHVFLKNYEPMQTTFIPSVGNLKTFLEGWYIHLKWQRLFKDSGRAVEIEKTRLDPVWGVYYTPDIIAKFEELTQEDLWVLEIKSMSTKSYQAMLDKHDPKQIHASGYKQAQMYMYFSNIRYAAFILEDKNTQDHRIVSFQFDPEFVKPYIHRMNVMTQLSEKYDEGVGVPLRVCDFEDDTRSRNCPMRHVCWLKTKQEREPFRLNRGSEQINASLMHENE